MRLSKRSLCILVGSISFLLASGCGQSTIPDGKNQLEKTEVQTKTSLTFQDDTGRTVALQTQPKRIVVLSPQLLDL